MCLRITQAGDWFDEQEKRLATSDEDWGVSAVRYRSDASNTEIFSDSAVRCTEVSATYTFRDAPGFTSTLEIRPDVQLILEGKTAPNTFKLIEKQVNLVNAPLFNTAAPQVRDGKRTFHWTIAVTDGGGDEVGARQMLKERVESKPGCAFVDLDCQQHATSNGQKKTHGVGDSVSHKEWKLRHTFFGSVAKFSSTLRARRFTLSRKLKRDRCRDAAKILEKPCPKPVTTRWGTVRNTQGYMKRLKPHRAALVSALSDLVADESDSKSQKRPLDGASVPAPKRRATDVSSERNGETESTQLDSTAFVAAQQREFRKDALASVRDMKWWSFLDISYKTSDPWHHYHLFLESDVTKKYGSHSTHISCLVRGRCDQFSQEFADMFAECWWHYLVDEVAAADDIGSPSDADHLVVVAVVSLTLCNHGDYDRRVKRVIDTFPIRTVALCKEELPSLRKCVADELLDPSASLNQSTRVFVEVFRDELQQIVDSDGHSCPPMLCAAVAALRAELLADTQAVESTNKTIQTEGKKQNKMRRILVASRVTQIKAINSELRTNSLSETDSVPYGLLRELAQECCAVFNSNRYKKLWYDNTRFVGPAESMPAPLLCDTPAPSVDVLVVHPDPSAADVASPSTAPSASPSAAAPPDAPDACGPAVGGDAEGADPHDGVDELDNAVWAKAMSLKWSWCWDKTFVGAQYVLHFEFGPEDSGYEQYWLCCSKHHHTGMLHRCTYYSDSESDTDLTLDWPLVVQTATTTFATWHREASSLDDPGVLRVSRHQLRWRTVPDKPFVVASIAASTSTCLFEPLLDVHEQLQRDELARLQKQTDAKAKKKAADAAKGPSAKAAAKRGAAGKSLSLDARLLDRARRLAKAKVEKMRQKLAEGAGDMEPMNCDDAADLDLQKELEAILPSDSDGEYDGEDAAPDHDPEVAPEPALLPTPVSDPPFPTSFDLSAWIVSFKYGMRIMQDRKVAVDGMTLDPARQHNLSLVMINQDSVLDIAFVYWARTSLKLGTGNKVRINPKTHDVKFTLTNSLGMPDLKLTSMIDDGSVCVIHPDVGVAMYKPRDRRETIPVDMWHLYEQWQVAVSVGLPPLAETCHLCSTDRSAPLRTCPICTLTSHASCCRRATASIIKDHVELIDPAIRSEFTFIPSWWRVCSLCSLCTSHVLLLPAS